MHVSSHPEEADASRVTRRQAAASFVVRNYHLLGLSKKFLVALLLYSVRSENIDYLLAGLHAVFTLQLVAGLWLKPFILSSINYLRSLSDFLILGQFIVIQVIDH